MNESNLQNLKDLTQEQRREIAVKGAKASVQARRERAKIKECFNILSSISLNNEERDKLKAIGITDENLTNDMLIAYNVIQKAKNGDAKAIKTYLELTGQDKEIELKERDLELKEYSLNLNEYKACGDRAYFKGEYNAYLKDYISNRDNTEDV